MDVAMLIVALGAMLVAGAAAVAAIVQARAAVAARDDARDARDESRVARDESVRLAAEANAAFVRSAAAQERANEIAEASLPVRQPKIQLQQLGGTRWAATNIGDLPASSARVVALEGYVDVDDEEPRGLDVGDSLFFNSVQTFGSGTPRIAVELAWIRADGEEERSRNEVTLP